MQVLTSDTAITKTINVGTIGKASTVKLYGCTFSDLTTTKNINGVTTLSVVIPAPTSIYESVLAEVLVDGQRFESFQVTSSGVKQFDSRYFIKPYLKEDADLSSGPLFLSGGSSQTIVADLSLLPRHTAMPTVVTYMYYDWATDLMYFFGSDVTSLSVITSTTKVWVVSFADDPVVDYSSYSGAPEATAKYPHYLFIFTASGRVIEIFARTTSFEYKDRKLSHGLKAATVCCVDASDSSSYSAKAVLLTVDLDNVIRKYKLSVSGAPTILGSPVATSVNVARIVSPPSYSSNDPYLAVLISTETRANIYNVNVNTNSVTNPSLTKLDTTYPNLQFIDCFIELRYTRALAYDFSLNQLVYVYFSGSLVPSFSVNQISAGVAGRLVRSRTQLAATDYIVNGLTYGNRYYYALKPYMADQGWPYNNEDTSATVGRVRKAVKPYIIDGTAIPDIDQPFDVRFNGKYLSFKLANTVPTGLKIVLPPSLSGSIKVNGVASNTTLPSAEVQITFEVVPDRTSYYIALGRTALEVTVDGVYSLTVGEAGKNSVVTVYGGTLLDGTTTVSISGVTEVKFNIPVPATYFESNIAEIYVDGKRAAFFTRQPYQADLHFKKFDSSYFSRPYKNSDIDASKGILKIVQSKAAAGLPTFVRIDLLAQRTVRPAQTKYCYYDYYTDKMYWFEVASPSQITEASYVYVEDFSADPLACYQQLAYMVGSPFYGDYIFTVLFHKSGKVRLQHPFSSAASYTRQLPHDIVAGCAYGIVFNDTFSLDGSETLIVSDSAGNLYKYVALRTGAALSSKTTGPQVVKLISPSEWVTAPVPLLALTDESRMNAYSLSVAGTLTLTRQPSNSATIDTQTIGATLGQTGFKLLLSYDFSLNKLRVVNLDGSDFSATFAKNFALLSGTGGLLVNSRSVLVAADAYLRSAQAQLPHVSKTLAYANPVTFLDSNNDYGDTTINQGVYNNKADGTVEAVVANAIGPTVVESILYDWTGTNTEGKKVKYIDVYNWDGTKYVLHQTLNTKPVVVGTYKETLTLDTPMLLHSSRKIKLAARVIWGGYGDISYRWVTELNVMINSA